MYQQTQLQLNWALDTADLDDAYTDFIQSRQAMRCTPGTLRWYGFTAGRFVDWLKETGVYRPEEISARYVRAYLSGLFANGLCDSTIHGHARAVRTLVRFLHHEKYIPDPIVFDMPAVDKKRLLVLSVSEILKVLSACLTIRDKMVIHLLADSGIRRAEACALNWGDVNIETGLIRVLRGKGGKYRKVVIGESSRKVLLAYQKTVCHYDNDPLIQTKTGTRLTLSGMQSAFMRISERAGVKVTPHALRRTFATLSHRAGMDLFELQDLMGHASLDMTKHYIQMLDEDLLEAHRNHGPIDRYLSEIQTEEGLLK